MRALGPYSAWTPRGPWTRVIHRQRSAAARRGRVALPRIGPRLRPPVAVPEPPPGAGWSLAAPATGIAIAGPLACRADRTMAAMNWSLGSSAPPSATRRERERPDALRVPRGRWVRGPLRDRRHFKVDAVHACAVGSCSCQVRAADHLEKELTMLNERAREIHSFIQRFRREKGSAPTIREIGRQFGISSTNGVRYYLNLLEKAGYIRRTGGISRGIGPSSATATAAPGIPVLGRVAAGQPLPAEAHWGGPGRAAGHPGARPCRRRPADPRRGELERLARADRHVRRDRAALRAPGPGRQHGRRRHPSGRLRHRTEAGDRQSRRDRGRVPRGRGYGQVLPAPKGSRGAGAGEREVRADPRHGGFRLPHPGHGSRRRPHRRKEIDFPDGSIARSRFFRSRAAHPFTEVPAGGFTRGYPSGPPRP